MPDGGTPVWRFRWNTLQSEYSERETAWGTSRREPGAWYPVALADARERVVQAARAVDESERAKKDDIAGWLVLYRALRVEVAALAELEATTSRETGT